MAFVAFLSPVSLPARNSTFQSVVSRRPRNSHAPRACKSAGPLLPRGFGTPRPQGPDAAKFGFVGSDQLGLVFTCNVCETRVAKKVKRKSYETGVVLVQCPGCEKYHVIADNLGYYTGVTHGMKNVEEFAKAKGDEVKRVTGDVFDLEKLICESADAAVDVDVGRGDVAAEEVP